MKSLLVSGSDTDVGKTWVAGLITRLLCERGGSVQVVKPVETGAMADGRSDTERIVAACGANDLVSAFTLLSFREPVAPALAARLEGESLELRTLPQKMEALPRSADWRVIEGAGSIASPITDSGEDWTDFALQQGIDTVVLVVRHRVGAIGQSRLAYDFCVAKGLRCGIWLNEVEPQNPISRQSTVEGIRDLEIPLWGCSSFEDTNPREMELEWL